MNKKNKLKHTFFNNAGDIVEVWSNLKIGDEVLCVKNSSGVCDGGNSNFSFHGSHLTKGETYKIDYISYSWHYKGAPYVVNDDGALTFCTTEFFKPVK